MRCTLVFVCIIIDLHLITFICTKLLSNSSYIYAIKCMFSIVFSEVALRAAKWNAVLFDLFLEQDPTFPPTFLILKLFIRFLLVGVREGLGISLSHKCKQISIFFGRIVYVYELFSTWNEPYNGIKNQALYNFFAIIGPSLFTVDSWWS
jgi:hypothetical protein